MRFRRHAAQATPDGTPVGCVFAGVLDGRRLWLAVDALPGRLALRDPDGEVVDLPSEGGDEQPGYLSTRLDLAALTRAATYDVVVVDEVVRPVTIAGIPLTAGFIGKWAVFAAAWSGGAQWLVVVAVVISVIAAFFYIRVIVLMFFSEPAVSSNALPTEVVRPGWTTLAVVGVGVVATVAFGVFPGPLLDLAQQAGEFIAN